MNRGFQVSKSYSEIKKDYPDNNIPYSVLLTATEWINKREKIKIRENNVCQICNKSCMDDFILEFKNNYLFLKPATVEFTIKEDEFGRLRGGFELLPMDESLIPHVHHTYYLLGNLPWEYPEKDLMFLCHKCHKNIHDTQEINVYRNNKKMELSNFTPCRRCNGVGYLVEYNYHQNGICFRCNGACFEEWI